MLQRTIKAHSGGFICTIRYIGGKLISGGKDGKVAITEPASGTVEKTVDFGNLVRAVDMRPDKSALVGLRDGTIYTLNIDSGAKNIVMQSHCEGEVWGLAAVDDSRVVTSGDDNKIMVWDITARKCVSSSKISSKSRKPPKGGASTLSDLPPSQCARAVAYNKKNGHIAVGQNDGTLSIRTIEKPDAVIAENTDSQEWIEAIEYSPDGTKLAVGSHDDNIYIYDVDQNYKQVAKCTKHNSFITSVDWSADNKYIRSICGAHELLFFTAADGQQDPNGASNTVGTEWAQNNAKYGWSVEGIFPSGTDGTHINGVDWSEDRTLIATGDDYGLVNVFKNPCRANHKPISLRGHSEHVVRVRFHKQDTYLFSVGGYDQTLMQWRRS